MPTRRLLTLLALSSAPMLAHAASRSATLQGDRLSIDGPCARHVTIEPDPGLHGQVVVDATADHPEELDRLLLGEAGATVGVRPPGCWLGVPPLNSPTLELVIRVPSGLPLAINDAGAGRWDVGAVGGPLQLREAGAVGVHDAAVTTLDAELAGSTGLTLGRVDGTAVISLSGRDTVLVDQAAMPSLTLNLSGAGQATVAHGQVGRATVRSSGVGTVTLGASVGDATVTLDGVGTVRLARVTGTLSKEVNGVGTVTVGP